METMLVLQCRWHCVMPGISSHNAGVAVQLALCGAGNQQSQCWCCSAAGTAWCREPAVTMLVLQCSWHCVVPGISCHNAGVAVHLALRGAGNQQSQCWCCRSAGTAWCREPAVTMLVLQCRWHCVVPGTSRHNAGVAVQVALCGAGNQQSQCWCCSAAGTV